MFSSRSRAVVSAGVLLEIAGSVARSSLMMSTAAVRSS